MSELLEPTATITEHKRMNALGQVEVLRYEWKGGIIAKLTYFQLVDQLNIFKPLKVGDRIQLGSLRLRVLSYDPMTRSIEVVRDNWFWIVIHSLHTSLRLLDLVYRRFILTLVIWNLADYSPGTLPTYRDIKIIKSLLYWAEKKYLRVKCAFFHRSYWDYQTYGGIIRARDRAKDRYFHHAHICSECDEIWPCFD